MSSIGNLLSDPAFWLGSVFIGLFINLFSSYLYPKLEKRLNNLRHELKNQNAEEETRFNRKVSLLADDPTAEMRLRLQRNTWLLQVCIGIGAFISALLFLLLLDILPPKTNEQEIKIFEAIIWGSIVFIWIYILFRHNTIEEANSLLRALDETHSPLPKLEEEEVDESTGNQILYVVAVTALIMMVIVFFLLLFIPR